MKLKITEGRRKLISQFLDECRQEGLQLAIFYPGEGSIGIDTQTLFEFHKNPIAFWADYYDCTENEVRQTIDDYIKKMGQKMGPI